MGKEDLNTVLQSIVKRRLYGLNNNLQQLRKKKGISQIQMAQSCGTSQAVISYIESQKDEITVYDLLLYCEKFMKTPNDLLGYNDLDAEDQLTALSYLKRLDKAQA